MTSADSTPVRPFGHGLSYTIFARTDLVVAESAPTGGSFTATVRVRNTGARSGIDLVQLYARDVFASVTRPVAQLLGYLRVPLQAGEEVEVRFEVPAARLAFTGREGVRIVEPGRVELWVGPDCATRETEAALELVGDAAAVDASSQRLVGTEVHRAAAGVPA